MRQFSTAVLLVFSLFIGGCSDPNKNPSAMEFGGSHTLVMGPALRMVTQRDRPIPGTRDVLPTMCSEPSPDVAIAFGQSLAAQGSVNQPGGASVSGNLNVSSTEVATALAGRTAGVLALRDGLYAACQSYVNGVIGHDAYALILSQYGNLLVALAGTGQTSAQPVSPRDAAITAMLVACISEWDPTRRRGSEYNPLLSVPRCSSLMNAIAAGKLLTSGKAAGDTKKNEKPASKMGALTGTTVTAKTVSTYSAPSHEK